MEVSIWEGKKADQVVQELKIQNGYLAMLAEGSRQEIYGSMAQIASIVRGNDVERNQRMFPIGDQIIMSWKDMDDANHNTDATAYQVAWDIVHHETVTLRDGSRVPGMFIQMHKCTPYGVQFSHGQAFIKCAEALPAGTYDVTLNAKYDTIPANTILEFTTTQPVPANGRIYLSTARAVSTYAAGGTTAIETVTAQAVSSPSGTSLGVTGTGGLNTVARMQNGSNRWGTSAIRQYLNHAGQNWWTNQEDFDIRPDQYSKYGFMSGFGPEFLNAVKPVRVITALNSAEAGAQATEETFDTFFLPSLQQMNVTPQLENAEGSCFEYWRRRLGLTGYAIAASNYVFDAFKIPAVNANSAQGIRLRSAELSSSFYTNYVNLSGCINNHGYATYTLRMTPVCVIC